MSETYIPSRHVVKIYGIPTSHLRMLRAAYDVRVIPRGKQYSYCEEDVINYIFGIRPEKITLVELAARWFAGTDPKCGMREAVIQTCADELNISRSSAYAGWIKYKEEHKNA